VDSKGLFSGLKFVRTRPQSVQRSSHWDIIQPSDITPCKVPRWHQTQLFPRDPILKLSGFFKIPFSLSHVIQWHFGEPIGLVGQSFANIARVLSPSYAWKGRYTTQDEFCTWLRCTSHPMDCRWPRNSLSNTFLPATAFVSLKTPT